MFRPNQKINEPEHSIVPCHVNVSRAFSTMMVQIGKAIQLIETLPTSTFTSRKRRLHLGHSRTLPMRYIPKCAVWHRQDQQQQTNDNGNLHSRTKIYIVCSMAYEQSELGKSPQKPYLRCVERDTDELHGVIFCAHPLRSIQLDLEHPQIFIISK